MKDRIKKNIKDPRWIIEGIIWGMIMWVFVTLIVPLFKGSPITSEDLIAGAVTWLIGGLFFGFVMHIWPGISARRYDP